MNLSTLTIGTGAANQAVSAGISPTSRTVITARTGLKLAPAIFAQSFVSLTNAFAAAGADRRPEKLIKTLQTKRNNSFSLYLLHAANYTKRYGN